MVPDAPRFAHARCGKDDRSGNGIEPDGFRHAIDEVERGIAENIGATGILQSSRILSELAGDLVRQRGIDEYLDVGDRARTQQEIEIEQQLSGPLEREGGNDQATSAHERRVHFGFEQLAAFLDRHFFTLAPAVGGFANHMIELLRAFRIELECFVVRPDVARAHCPHAACFEFDRGGTEDVSGVTQARAKAGRGLDPLFERYRPAQPPRGAGIGLGVDRRERFFAGTIATTVAPCCLGFVDTPGIGEHVFQKIAGRLRAPDRALEAFRRELGEKAAVVEVGVRENHPRNALGIERKPRGVELFQGARALEQAAIAQQRSPIVGKFHARAGDGVRGTGESQRQGKFGHDVYPWSQPRRQISSAINGAMGMTAAGPGTVSVARTRAIPAARSRSRSRGAARQWVASASILVAPASRKHCAASAIVCPLEMRSSIKTTERPATRPTSGKRTATCRSPSRRFSATMTSKCRDEATASAHWRASASGATSKGRSETSIARERSGSAAMLTAPIPGTISAIE